VASRRTPQTTQVGKLVCLEGFCSIKKIRKIEVCDVITNDDIRVDFFHKVPPSLKHICFIVEGDDLGTNNVGAGI
jgi:hypothetical protein